MFIHAIHAIQMIHNAFQIHLVHCHEYFDMFEHETRSHQKGGVVVVTRSTQVR